MQSINTERASKFGPSRERTQAFSGGLVFWVRFRVRVSFLVHLELGVGLGLGFGLPDW